MHEQNETAEPTDPEFDALLRRAAYVSTVGLAGAAARLFPAGHTLLDGRLRVLRRIGEGGMGVVYEAFDERRRSTVALKTLSRLDAQGIYRLKQEFRSLADVMHPNLCHLHELFSEGEWFFTMELVEGQRLDRWLRPRGALDETRLREALPQLTDAVAAIHRAGKLHRDLKPSNVLVTAQGRVVVLDFGLAVDLAAGGVGQTVLDDAVSGTPGYMSPEQAAGRGATPASDYYAVGAMLFEALTGQRPFAGRVGEILAAKQRDRAPAVHSLNAHAPGDLTLLCDALLEREPALRPDESALQRQLGLVRQPSGAPTPDPLEREPILGRELELAALRSAYDEMQLQRPVVVFVSGESGMGKSALVAQLLEELRVQGHAALLAGRCYERESVPFKAFDAVVDELSRYLRRLARDEAAALMPRDVFALARLFPVLERVAAIADAPRKDIPDPQELQQRAFAAFAELLGRIRDRRPVVIYVDDLQWACRDSSSFMSYLFAQRDPTPLLLIVSHRSEGAAENVLLQQTLRAAHKNPRIDCRQVSVGPLPLAAAHRLAERMLGQGASQAAAAIAQEARGSPFFVGELVRHAQLPALESRKLSLEEAVMRHVQRLPDAARALLDVLAVAGRPLPVQLALDAAQATHEAADSLLAERLLRAGSVGSAQRTIECYHDKIREYVAGALAPSALCQVHRSLAEQLSTLQVADPEHLALHFHGAGELERAARYYEQAGDLSAAALAFDYAAGQYQQALSLFEPTAGKRLRVKLAAALASAGNSREAAEMYRAAAQTAEPALALEHMRTAAHLLMTSGYLDEGRVLLGEVLRAIGLSLPRSRRGAIAAALLGRARLKLRGLRLCDSDSAAPAAEARLAALWTVVQGSVGNDPFVMVEMSARYTRLALDVGSKAHAARALSMEAYLGSFDGPSTRARSEGLLLEAERLTDSASQPELSGWVQEMRGCVLVHEGRFGEARPVLQKAIQWLETRCKGVPFELACGRGYDLNAANHRGDFADIADRAPTLVEDSLRRGDLYQACGLASFAVQGWLASRGLDYTQSRFGEAKRRFLPQAQFQWADYLMLLGELYLAQYEARPQTGLLLLEQRWTAIEHSQLMRMQIAGAMMLYCRAGCVLGTMAGARATGERVQVNAAALTLSKSPLPHAAGWAAVLEAGLAQHAGDTERAAEQLRSAVRRFDDTGLRMYAAASRRRLGPLLAGDEGRALLAAGDATMSGEGVVDFEATTTMLTPGAPRARA